MLEVRTTYTPQGLQTVIYSKKKKIEEITKQIKETAHRKQSDHISYARFTEQEFLQYKIEHMRFLREKKKQIEKELEKLEHYNDKGWRK